MRETVKGPLLRWISRVEHEEQPDVVENSAGPRNQDMQSSTGNSSGKTPLYIGRKFVPSPYQINSTSTAPLQMTASVPQTNDSSEPTTAETSVMQSLNTPTSTTIATSRPFVISPLQAFISPNQDLFTAPNPTSLSARLPPPTQSEPVTESVRVAKSYAVHELGQQDDMPKPKWEETMTALFGDHVKWGDVKVFSSKNRPLGEVCFRLGCLLD